MFVTADTKKYTYISLKIIFLFTSVLYVKKKIILFINISCIIHNFIIFLRQIKSSISFL